MSKPEIARRCQACGASIREAASFCPQCGEVLAPQDLEGKPTTSVVTTPLVALAPGDDEANAIGQTEPGEEKLETNDPGDTPPQKAPGKAAIGKVREAPVGKARKATVGKVREATAAKVRDAPVGKVREKIQRGVTLARDVEGDVINRVQKVRQMSGVVLDEAGYDPSLRFVLVAAALFLLFLLVLVLNKVIG